MKDASLYAYTNQILGAMNGLFSAGGMFGALFMGWLCDAHGRKTSLLASGILAIIGGALQGGSVHIAMMLVARFITGWSAGNTYSSNPKDTSEKLTRRLGMLVTLVPVFQSELAPPSSRGFLVGQHGNI
jgi:MFS family permease